MEIQFEQKPVRYLCRTAWGEKTVEETAEIKLPAQEAQPQLLGAWGQSCLMEKHWSDGAVSVSGGVNVWSLLQGADGVYSVPGWIPYKESWDLHDTQHDGRVVICAQLKSVDARMTGAGKLIITAQISLYLQALEPCTVNRYVAEQLPEDIYVQKKTVVANVPVEVGEKRAAVEQSFTPEEAVRQVLYHRTEPELVECKVLGDKLVFRGEVRLESLCCGETGDVFLVKETVPVSQYVQLDGEYGSDCMADVIPVVLTAEAEKKDNGQIEFRADVLWQYVLHSTLELEGITDAYSNRRAVETEEVQLCVPTLKMCEAVSQETACAFSSENGTVIDQCVMAGCAEWDERSGNLRQTGSVRTLFRDGEGQLKSALLPFEMETPAQQLADGYGVTAWQKHPKAAWSPQDGICISAQCGVYCMEDGCLPCCKSLTAADAFGERSKHPSLILRRAGEEDLWQLAKACGSSEAAIRSANGFDGAVEKGRMLLIPVE